MREIETTHRELLGNKVSARDLAEEALAAIGNESGEGERTFLKVYEESARVQADAIDATLKAGIQPGPLAGVTISIKDLFDVKGEVTRAAAKTRENADPASQDALAVQRLRAAGAVIVGRTNMTEFAFSALGINPHYGTPLNPYDRAQGRVPGGSSSGAGVSVADKMAMVGIGSDTGGSIRIPSSLCGVTGFKPTAGRHSMDGVFPLCPTLDTIGPLANSLTCCHIVDSVLAGQEVKPLIPLPVQQMRFLVPTTLVLDGLDEAVASAFQNALSRLSDAGAHIEERTFPAFNAVVEASAAGGFAGAESYAVHRTRLATHQHEYDPRVVVRIMRGRNMDAADYFDLLAAEKRIRAEADAATGAFDAVLMPSTARIAPTVSSVAEDDAFFEANAAMLRNTSLGNFLKRCGASIPMHQPGTAPAGLMVMGETNGDAHTLAVAAGVEAVLRAAGLGSRAT
ncbi:MAG: amidase [Pseudomonadota bacterium]